MSAPILEVRASQRRLLNAVLRVRCPNALHHWAGPDVPCYPPSEPYPWGWVCLPRIERDADTREARDRYVEAQARARKHDDYLQRAARREAKAATQRAEIAATIAGAPTTTKEES